MKKRLITLLVAFVMMFSLIVPAYATETTGVAVAEDLTGGLDFYSITINYTKDILVDYQRVEYSQDEYKYKFQDDDGNKVMADKVILRAGVNEANDYIGYDKSKPTSQSNFYQLDLSAAGINATATYSKFPYEYSYITHIQDGAILKSKTAFSFYGIFAPYDEGEAYKNQNPNVVYNKDGYALDAKVDSKGRNYLIDINEYQVAPDGLWYDNSGNRVELFHEIPIMNYVGNASKNNVDCQRAYTDDLKFFTYDFRIDSKTGMIKKFEDMKAYYYISKADLVQFFKDNKDTVSPTSPKSIPLTFLDPNSKEEGFNYEEELAKILDNGTDKASELKRGERFRKDYYYMEVYPSTYRVVRESSSVNDEGKVVINKSRKMSADLYNNKDTVFAQEYIARDAVGNRIYSTPVLGCPKLNVEIESISVEFDAMGTQLYTDAASDPQSKNKITVSINDFPQNIALKEQALADKWISQQTFDSYVSRVLGTVSGKTTSTEANWDISSVRDSSYKSTVASVDLGLSKEELKALPLTATIFLSFDIETTQSEAAFNEEFTPENARITNQNAKIWEKPAVPDPIDEKSNFDSMLFVWIGIAVVAVIAIVVILVVVLKKKKK